MDEVGRGSWAGPLTVAAVVIPRDRRLVGVRDSKQLSEARREQLFPRIVEWSENWGVGHVWPAECDRLGMSEAQRVGARRAIANLGVIPDAALVDGSWDFVSESCGVDATMLVKGDSRSLSIAAASVVAKVSRDRIMRKAAEDHPSFGFSSNKGYPCPVHRRALQGYGPTAIHRRSWAFMDSLIWPGLHR
jgi:ribonuclease HII